MNQGFKRDLACAGALAAALGTALVLVDPRGDFPLNDDFVFAESVRRLLETGSLRLSEWSLPANITHILTGTLAGLALSPDNWSLRLFTMTLSAAASGLFFLFLRDLGIRRSRALIGAAALASGPVYLAMSASFHADINSLFFQVAGLWAFRRGLKENHGWLALASLFFSLTFLNRQSAVLALVGAVGLLLYEGKLKPKAAAAILGPAFAVGTVYLLWFFLLHGVTWAWTAGRLTPSLSSSPDPKTGLDLLMRVNGAVQTAALFLLPLSLGMSPSLWRKPVRPRELALLSAVAGAALLGIARLDGMPLIENTLSRLGLGVVTLNAPASKFAGVWGHPLLWRAIDLLCLFSSLVWARLLCSPAAAGARETLRALLWPVLPPFIVLFTLPAYYDRYLLTLLPAAIASALAWIEDREFGLAPAAAGCLALAAFSVVGLKDYFAWNRARWEAGLHAVSLGLLPEQVENGFDWDGQWTLERNMKRLLARKPSREIGAWDWMAENRVLMVTSFSPKPPREDFEPVADFPYRTPFSQEPQSVYLHRLLPGK